MGGLFTQPRGPATRPHAAGPFPALEPAEDFARRLWDEWPADQDPEIEVVQVEATEPIIDLIVGER